MAYNSKIRTAAKQSFEVGEVVKIGFVSGLEIIKKVATPGDFRPDFFVLWQAEKNRFYAFQPHYGLVRCGDLQSAMSAY